MSHHQQHQHHSQGHGPGAHATAHDHDHDHDHSAAHNAVVEANRSFFDKQAAIYDTRLEKMLERLTAELRSRLDFIGVDWAEEDEDDEDDEDDDAGDGKEQKNRGENKRQVRMLDYACATGTISRALAPYVTQCVGIDLSENMVAVYNDRARNQGLAPDEMFAVAGDLASAADPDPAALSGPGFRDFDLAAVGGGFHHFLDPQLAAVRLVERLRPGGVLFIWDFLAHGHGDGHGGGSGGGGGEDRDEDHGPLFSGPARHTITHHGFSESGIRDIYEKAGAGKNFELVILGSGFLLRDANSEHEKEGMRRRVFFARGEKGRL